MSELLSLNLVWWHWIVLGLILVVSEIFIPLFIALWFGISAIIVGLIDLIFDTSFMMELLLWIVLSVIFLSLWYIFFKDKTVSKSGQSDFKLNTKGIVIEAIKIHDKGKVKFDTPVLGSSRWHAIADEPLEVGDIISIVDVNGQLLKVKKEK
jgi:membrane protein implicated in regulation of membrane protease activity